ncbi:tRNA ligase [Geranomyces michiganensis]|nr:tRNA ligase [Geranomyces michiganensis]
MPIIGDSSSQTDTSEGNLSQKPQSGGTAPCGDDEQVLEDEDEDEQALAAAATTASKTLLDMPSASWKSGSSVPYSALCKTFEKIEDTTKRLQITAYLTAFLKEVIRLSPQDLVACIYLCLNRIGPEYEGKELGIGESILMKAVAQATGRTTQSIKADVDIEGDLGSVAQSQAQKIAKINKLLVACKDNEPKYLIRSLEGKLRIRLAELTVLPALAHACVLSTPGKYIMVAIQLPVPLLTRFLQSGQESFGRKAKGNDGRSSGDLEACLQVWQITISSDVAFAGFNLCPDSELPNYDEIIPALLKYGIEALPDKCKLRPGVPLKPMLAHPTKSLTEVLNRFENLTFTCEYKYDGERAQIHLLDDGSMKIYSRNSENLSPKYPDIMESLPKVRLRLLRMRHNATALSHKMSAMKVIKSNVKSFVLDCEAVAWDREKKCILPFQVLSTRKRKDVTTADIQVQVCVFAFDILFLNGEALTTKTLKHRREMLYEHFNEVPGIFTFAKHMESTDVEDIQTFLNLAVEGNCEGLMVKTLEHEASYEPSKRSRNWLKVKKDYLSGVGDTFDLVVVGAYNGRGKRTGWYGGYLLACYDDDKEEYQTICKLGTGFTEEDLAQHVKALEAHKIDKPKPYYDWTDTPGLRPDVWFEPVQVWEIKAADLSISPTHKAAMGLVNPNKGVSLRFPRFLRIREDKSAEQATTASQVADFYRSQSINSTSAPLEDC